MSQQATSDASAGRCGSTLASMHSGVVGEVALGTVDGDSGDRPREHIFVGSKAPWHDITDSLPQYEACLRIRKDERAGCQALFSPPAGP